MKSINDYKQLISIYEFIKFRSDLGFQFKRDGQNVIAYKLKQNSDGTIAYNLEGKSIKEDKLTIARISDEKSGSREVYFENNDYGIKGSKATSNIIKDSIYDFLDKTLSKNHDYVSAKKLLIEYLNKSEFSIQPISQVLKEILDSNRINESRIQQSGVSAFIHDFIKENPITFTKAASKSIIDFVHEFVLRNPPGNINFKQIFGVLNDYLNSGKFIELKNSTIDILTKDNKAKSTNSLPKNAFTFPGKETFDYLKSRGLGSINSVPEFIGQFGTYNDDQKGYTNKPAFPLICDDKKLQTIQWIEFDGEKHEFKKFAKDVPRNGSVFTSNYNGERNIGILTESPEKAMAHFLLYKDQLTAQKMKPVYYSSCGNLTHESIKTISKLSFEKSIKNYICSFDNDHAGIKYTLDFAAYKNGVDISVTSKQLEGNSVQVEIIINDGTDQYNHDKFNRLFKIPEYKTVNGKLSFTTTPEIFFQKFSAPHISVHQSLQKDFLDDLNLNQKLPFKFDKNLVLNQEKGL